MSLNGNSSNDNSDNPLYIGVSLLIELGELLYSSYIFTNDKGETENGGTYENCSIHEVQTYPLEVTTMTLSVILILILSFMTQRVSFLKKTCFGRPGPVVPMRPLDNHDFGFEYTLAFLAVAEYIYVIIIEKQNDTNDVAPVLKFFSSLYKVSLIALLSYPIFVAITYRHLVAYASGILILSLDFVLSVINIYNGVQCKATDKALTTSFKTVFFSAFTLILMFTLIRRIIIHVRRNKCLLNDHEDFVCSDENLCYTYVRYLLVDKEPTGGSLIPVEGDSSVVHVAARHLKFEKIRAKVKSHVYKDIPGFRVPPRLLIGIAVGSYFAYHIALDKIDDFTPMLWRFFRLIKRKYVTTEMDTGTAFGIIFNNMTTRHPLDYFNACRRLAFLYIHLLFASIVTALVLAFTNAIIHSYLIIRNFRLHFHKIAQEGFSTIVKLKKAPQPNQLVLGFVKFSGFQAAFILWSIIVLFFIISYLLFFLIGFIIFPLIYIKGSWVVTFLKSVIPVIVISVIFNYLQSLLVKYVFVKERGQLMEINNRRLFDIYCHFAFFLNVLMGLFGSLKRIFIWIFSGLFCFCRIDFTSLPEYIRRFDSGFMCYLGFLYTEQYHYNPTLRCFVYLLLRVNKELPTTRSTSLSMSLPPEKDIYIHRRKINYRIKWKVSYTLIRNPQLISMKKIFERN